jgi:hypothetical protein
MPDLDAKIRPPDFIVSRKEFAHQWQLQSQSHEGSDSKRRPSPLLVYEQVMRVLLVKIECERVSRLSFDEQTLGLDKVPAVRRHTSLQTRWKYGRPVENLHEVFGGKDQPGLPGNEIIIEVGGKGIRRELCIDDYRAV